MRRLQLGMAIAGVVALTSGCDVLDDIEDRDATVQVHVTHHATPADGVFPNLGDEGQARVFDNDAGWAITLEEAFVVTADATLVACDGSVHELGLYWGPVPENISDTDLDLFSFGGVDVPPGEYCGVLVQYGPYVPIDERTASQYEMPEDEDALLGATAYVRGFAVQGEALVTFEARADAIVEVELDLRD